ncbi:uncharacterized protein LTR77_009511 [Saxophila tyrrhenica]|uniref:Caffeine-induced death protein Cid2 n=1 Tax=Saxophila tyrrhenica TaxID=1690608 RepID=A0AAV9P0P0_9PEZI|nr:hypothetical protein LTR77_009511 [Saxophila tyrrhenica]
MYLSQLKLVITSTIAFGISYTRAHSHALEPTDKLAGTFWKAAPSLPPPSAEEAPTGQSSPPPGAIMSRTPDAPRLTPQFCFNQTALRAPSSRSYQSPPDFLRVSRGAVDDTISQNLNALVTPGAQPFDPSITITRQPRPIGRRAIDPAACDQFKEKVLYPNWQMRSDVLNYCAGVATSPDSDDPQHVLRDTEDARARERIVDERLDPYSGRYFPRDLRTEALARLVRNERMVENIIRSRTWGLVGERCDNEGVDADQALNDWRKRQSNDEAR